jgi:hypothetical protein
VLAQDTIPNPHDQPITANRSDHTPSARCPHVQQPSAEPPELPGVRLQPRPEVQPPLPVLGQELTLLCSLIGSPTRNIRGRLRRGGRAGEHGIEGEGRGGKR